MDGLKWALNMMCSIVWLVIYYTKYFIGLLSKPLICKTVCFKASTEKNTIIVLLTTSNGRITKPTCGRKSYQDA